MPNEITYHEKQGVYRVKAEGMITFDDIMESIEALNKRGVADKLVYVLIDTLHQTSELSILDVGKVLNAMPGKKRFKSAILTSCGHINIKEHQLLAKGAREHGKAIKLFMDKERALKWLLQDQ